MTKRICPSCFKWFTPRIHNQKYNSITCRKSYTEGYRQKYMKAWSKKNHIKKLKASRDWYTQSKQKAMQLIMDTHGVQGCMYKIHPHIPLDLKEYKCWGELWLEHPNGGGSHNNRILKRNVLWAHFNNKRANPKEYMLLCQLHQIWNNHNYDGKSKKIS